MKLLYVSREFGNKKTGANQVMGRNLRALYQIVGKENIIEYYVPKTTLRTVAFSMLRLGSYGVSRRQESDIIEIVRQEKLDYVFFEGSLFGSLFKKIKRVSTVQTILFAHNLDTALSKHEISSRSIVGYMKYLFVKFNERRSAKDASKLICLNERDSQDFYNMFGRKADLVLPITFPSRLVGSQIKTMVGNYYLFVGSDFFPNVEGIGWFIENVAPFVNVKFRIVGSCCFNPELKNMCLPANVTLAGYVDHLDMEYEQAAGVVAPIFKGSGMKTKTIEALSYGKSVFGTSEAFAGVQCDYERVGAVCETADDFIKKLSTSDGETVNTYSVELFNKQFSDDLFVRTLEKFLKYEQ